MLEHLSPGLITIPLIENHTSFGKLCKYTLPGRIKNASSPTLIKNISNACCQLEWFHVDLLLNVSEIFSLISFLKYHLRYILLDKQAIFCLKLASFINDGIGKNPSSSFNVLISKSDRTLKLNIISE